LAEGASVLDVACGRGTSSFLMATMFPHLEVTGLDLLPGNLAAAETMYGNTPNLQYCEGDAIDIDLPSGSFDRVLCVEAAFQFLDRRRFIEEAWRVLTPGGVAVIVDFVWKSDRDRLIQDDEDTLLVRRTWQWEDFASVEEYRANAIESGFEIEAMYDWTNHVTAPLITIMSAAAWFARTRLGQRVFATAIPGMRAFTAGDWRDLIDAARGHRHVQRHSRYVALVLRRPEA
jgi:SAM-dependent methyltransferase